MRPDILYAAFPPRLPSYSSREQGKLRGDLSTPWRHAIRPGVIKKESSDESALIELLRYTHQIFCDCYDRRFVLGFTIAWTSLTVYHIDRAGVIGAKHINIFKDWKKFVQFLIAFAIMSPEARGFDPTMLTVLKRDLTGKAVPSYQLPLGINYSEFYWQVTMPKPKDEGLFDIDDMETEEFVLYMKLDIRPDIIYGQAKQVWRA